MASRSQTAKYGSKYVAEEMPVADGGSSQLW